MLEDVNVIVIVFIMYGDMEKELVKSIQWSFFILLLRIQLC